MVTAKSSVWHHINSQSDDSERACSADGLDLQVASSLLWNHENHSFDLRIKHEKWERDWLNQKYET